MMLFAKAAGGMVVFFATPPDKDDVSVDSAPVGRQYGRAKATPRWPHDLLGEIAIELGPRSLRYSW